MTAQQLIESGWERAEGYTKGFDGHTVLYCIDFSHGLMKIGATSDLRKRLLGITSHGLFRPMVSGIVAHRCPGHVMFAAEGLALRKMSSVFTVRGPEIFDSGPMSTVSEILLSAITECIDIPKRREFGPEDFYEMALSSNLFGAILHEATDAAKAQAANAVVEFMERKDMNLFEWENVCRGLHPLAIPYLTPMAEKNTVLIGRGVDYHARKTILAQYAIDLRPNQNQIGETP